MIGKVINKLLKDSSELSALVGTKIFPYAIDEEMSVPAVIYRVRNTVPNYSKDGFMNEISNVEVLSYSNKYMNCLDISSAVRSAIELKNGVIEGISVVYIRISSIEEDFDLEQGIYFSKINFTILTN